MNPSDSDSVPHPPLILFVGDDASSPEIAATLLRNAVGNRIAVATAGIRLGDSGGQTDEMLVAMGLNPAEEALLSARVLHGADRVIVLGSDIDVARLPGPRYEEWDLRQVNLEDRIEELSNELTRANRGKWQSIFGWLLKWNLGSKR